MNKVQNAAFISVNPNDVDHLAEASGMYVSVYLDKKKAPKGHVIQSQKAQGIRPPIGELVTISTAGISLGSVKTRFQLEGLARSLSKGLSLDEAHVTPGR